MSKGEAGAVKAPAPEGPEIQVDAAIAATPGHPAGGWRVQLVCENKCKLNKINLRKNQQENQAFVSPWRDGINGSLSITAGIVQHR